MQSYNQTKAPQTFSEMWQVVKDRFISTISFKGKTYTKREFHELSLRFPNNETV